MQSFILWAIFIGVFVIIFALIAIATRSVLGIAWGFLIAAIIAAVATVAVAGCTCYSYGTDFFLSPGPSCLGILMVLLVILGIIAVIVAYFYRNRQKKKLAECAVDECSSIEQLIEHPCYEPEEYYEEPCKQESRQVSYKSTKRDKLNCDSRKGCVGSSSVVSKIRERSHGTLA